MKIMIQCLAWLLLFSVSDVSSVSTPPSSPSSPTGSGNKDTIHSQILEVIGDHDPTKPVKYVDSYTITEPDHNGKSHSSQHHGAELFIDPSRHTPETPGSHQELKDLSKKFFDNRAIDEADFQRKVHQHVVAGQALAEISRGNVVRHTDDRQSLLLHHNRMTSDVARAHDQHDHVYDLTHTKEGYKLNPSSPRWLYDANDATAPSLPKEEIQAMKERLAQHKIKAREYAEERRAARKLYWNPETGQAEPDEAKERQAGAMERWREAKKAKKSEEKVAHIYRQPQPPTSKE